MTKEIKDVYFLILHSPTEDFVKDYSQWPRGDMELWMNGKTINYRSVSLFLDKILYSPQ